MTMPVVANMVQTAFRFRTVNPNGVAANAAYNASDPAQNAHVTWPPNVLIRYRVEIEENNGVTAPANGQLDYSLNGGTWTNVTGSSSVVRAEPCAGFTDGDAAGNLLTISTATFAAGTADDTSGDCADVNIRNAHTEFEWSIKVLWQDVADGDIIGLRNTALDVYNVTGRLTVGLPTMRTLAQTGVGR